MQALYPSAQVGGKNEGMKKVTPTDPMPMGASHERDWSE